MEIETIVKLQTITLVDSICFGLIYAFINPHILIITGDHLIVGIFSVLNLSCQLISEDITKIITVRTGKQFSLLLISVIATISNLVITLTNSFWIVIAARCIFSCVNQTGNVCERILRKNVPEGEVQYFLYVHGLLNFLGLIIGPIVAGSLFSYGFSYCCFLAAFLTLGNVWLSSSLTIVDEIEDEKNLKENSLFEKITEESTDVVRNFKNLDVEKNWDILMLKLLFTSSVTIFFSKFTQILKYNFMSDDISIGFTTSYKNALVFASPYILKGITGRFEVTKNLLVEYALCTFLICSILVCYAPFFSFYLLVCIPLIVSRCYLNSAWVELFASRNNKALDKFNKSINTITGLTMPIIFGLTCNRIGHYAVILFSVLPILFSLIIFHLRNIWGSISYSKQEENSKNKDE